MLGSSPRGASGCRVLKECMAVHLQPGLCRTVSYLRVQVCSGEMCVGNDPKQVILHIVHEKFCHINYRHPLLPA
jgi:hypothetical protein